jgi:hypothetical protein
MTAYQAGDRDNSVIMTVYFFANVFLDIDIGIDHFEQIDVAKEWIKYGWITFCTLEIRVIEIDINLYLE